MPGPRNGERERIVLVTHREPFHVVVRDGRVVDDQAGR